MSKAGWSAPNPGELLWCRFPELESIAPSPKSRPALVLSVDDEREPLRLRLAYGTSRRVHEIEPWEVLISPEDPEVFRLSGLALPTKFQFNKIVVLDYTPLWFAPAPGTPRRHHPRLGALHPSLVQGAAQAYAAALRRGRPP